MGTSRIFYLTDSLAAPPQKQINHHLVMYWMGEKGQGTDLQKAKDSELQ